MLDPNFRKKLLLRIATTFDGKHYDITPSKLNISELECHIGELMMDHNVSYRLVECNLSVIVVVNELGLLEYLVVREFPIAFLIRSFFGLIEERLSKEKQKTLIKLTKDLLNEVSLYEKQNL